MRGPTCPARVGAATSCSPGHHAGEAPLNAGNRRIVKALARADQACALWSVPNRQRRNADWPADLGPPIAYGHVKIRQGRSRPAGRMRPSEQHAWRSPTLPLMSRRGGRRVKTCGACTLLGMTRARCARVPARAASMARQRRSPPGGGGTISVVAFGRFLKCLAVSDGRCTHGTHGGQNRRHPLGRFSGARPPWLRPTSPTPIQP